MKRKLLAILLILVLVLGLTACGKIVIINNEEDLGKLLSSENKTESESLDISSSASIESTPEEPQSVIEVSSEAPASSKEENVATSEPESVESKGEAFIKNEGPSFSSPSS